MDRLNKGLIRGKKPYNRGKKLNKGGLKGVQRKPDRCKKPCITGFIGAKI